MIDLRRRRRALVRGDAARWMMLAVTALALSGAFAIVLVAGRTPPLARSGIADPELARRTLVVHVVLAAFVWQVAFLVGLFGLLPRPRRSLREVVAFALAALGVAAIVASVGLTSAPPVLSNYLPVLDHELFLAGLAVFTGAVTLALLDLRLVAHRREPTAVGHATRAAALTFLVAVATAAAAALTDPGGAPAVRYERLFWGGGHVLQTSGTMAMLAVWLALVHRLTRRHALRPRSAAILFALMLAPTLAGPWLATSPRPHPAFTTMMQLGLLPFIVVIAVAGIRALRAALPRGSTATVGLATSAGMTLVGVVFALGIRGDSTLVPAHYHLNVGAVTVSFMTFLLVAPPQVATSPRRRRLATWQPLVYGVGQGLFATGLAIAGFWGGAARKVYGAEQSLDAPVVWTGLALAGLGGVLALAGGVLFVALAARTWRTRASRSGTIAKPQPGREAVQVPAL